MILLPLQRMKQRKDLDQVLLKFLKQQFLMGEKVVVTMPTKTYMQYVNTSQIISSSQVDR